MNALLLGNEVSTTTR